MTSPYFSVIIPSRNRASLFARAIESVYQQKTNGKFEFEIITINDGSSQEQLPQYDDVIANYKGAIIRQNLRFRERGHGPSFSRNEGVNLAQGKYLCFLDDDDVWIDNEHLLELYEYMTAHDLPNNSVYLFQQLAETSDGKILTEALWNRDIVNALSIDGLRIITKQDISKSAGFTHLNCLICEKELFLQIGGFDESLRYEEDRDLYFRLIDVAEQVTIFSKDVAKHYVPDKQLAQTVSSSMLEIDKLHMRICSNIKLLSMIKDVDLRRSITKHLIHVLKSAVKVSGDLETKLFYSKLVISLTFSVKWHLYVAYLKLKSIL